MKTYLEFQGVDKNLIYDEIECPPIPEGTLISCPRVAGARIVSQWIYVDINDEVKQRLIAK